MRELLKSRSAVDFDEAFGREDRLTQAVTIFALLEMHKRGEATWDQSEIFGPIKIQPRRTADSSASRPGSAGPGTSHEEVA